MAELAQIEAQVNAEIRANHPVNTQVMDLDEAKAAGAQALFGEKYDQQVRVVTMGADGAESPYSLELCGGTHVARTGDIGALALVAESGIAAGVRRVEGVTGAAAQAHIQANNQTLHQLGGLVKAGRDGLLDKVQGLLDRNRQLERELDQLKAQLAQAAGADLLGQARELGGVKVLVAELSGVEAKALRDAMDQLKNQLASGVVLLAVTDGAKASLVAGVTQDLTAKVKAGDLIRHACGAMGGKGGGRPDMAQGGGDGAQLAQGLDAANAWLDQQLA